MIKHDKSNSVIETKLSKNHQISVETVKRLQGDFHTSWLTSKHDWATEDYRKSWKDYMNIQFTIIQTSNKLKCHWIWVPMKEGVRGLWQQLQRASYFATCLWCLPYWLTWVFLVCLINSPQYWKRMGVFSGHSHFNLHVLCVVLHCWPKCWNKCCSLTTEQRCVSWYRLYQCRCCIQCCNCYYSCWNLGSHPVNSHQVENSHSMQLNYH